MSQSIELGCKDAKPDEDERQLNKSDDESFEVMNAGDEVSDCWVRASANENNTGEQRRV